MRQDITKLLNDKAAQQTSLDEAASFRKKLERQVSSLTRDLHEKSAELSTALEEKGVLVCKCDNMANDVAELVTINHRLAAQVTHLAAHIVVQPTSAVSSANNIPMESPGDDGGDPSSLEQIASASSVCNDSQLSSLKAILQVCTTMHAYHIL